MHRITYDLLDRASVIKLLETPPVIDNQMFYPSIPCYIQPIYGLEVTILGIKDVLRAAPGIDRYIHNRYGDVIASSRRAINGDASVSSSILGPRPHVSSLTPSQRLTPDSEFLIRSLILFRHSCMFSIATAYLRPPPVRLFKCTPPPTARSIRHVKAHGRHWRSRFRGTCWSA